MPINVIGRRSGRKIIKTAFNWVKCLSKVIYVVQAYVSPPTNISSIKQSMTLAALLNTKAYQYDNRTALN